MTTLSLAPLRGLTDAIYRNTSARHFQGFSTCIAPFLSTFQGTKVKSAKLRDLLPENNQTLPVIPQILSKHPDQFVVLADMLYDLGYETVNWNLGCPYAMVANKKRGSGLLPYPEEIDRFLELIQDMKPALSIKTRIGRYTPAEIKTVLSIFNNYPLTELIIHPRLGIQMYKGQPDLDTFAYCLDKSVHPVTYNGDINTAKAYRRLQEQFPRVTQWMIGRGALANPFLTEQIKGILPSENQIQRLQQFHDDLFAQYHDKLHGSGHLLGRMKGVWFYLADRLSDPKKSLKRIQKARTIATYQDIIANLFQEEQLWKREK
jgi:tRNA-dihydrouridine synthase B